MNPMTRVFLAVPALAATTQADAAPVQSFFPPGEVASLLATELDLATFRSSLGPRRTPAHGTFSALGLSPSQVTDGNITFESEDWYYSITILERGDLNGDGIEDLAVCFNDQAKKGTYLTQQPLLLTRYSPSGRIIALAFDPGLASCGPYAR